MKHALLFFLAATVSAQNTPRITGLVEDGN